MNASPLAGVRILDLSRLLPGPFCTMLLADLGAEVIKIEDLEGGDYMRAFPPFIDGRSAYFLALNAGKKSLAVNLKAPAGRDLFLRLAATAGVIVESFRPGAVDRLGVGYAAARAVNPRVVYCSISGFGQDGPDRDRAGHDLDFISRAGLLSLCGWPEARPAIPPVQIADLSSAMYAAAGILAYLRESERTGQGAHLDIGMLDSAMSWMVMPLGDYAAGERGGRGRLPLSGQHPCYNVYKTRDGRDISLAAIEPKFWNAFCGAVGRDDLRPLQFSGKEEDLALFEALFAGRTAAEWTELLRATDCCCQVVPVLDEVLRDPHIRHRGLVIGPPPGGTGALRPGHPLRARDAADAGPCPGHGQHTAEILAGLGLAAAEIEGLEAAGVVRRGG
ncbi:MAG TPA: CaiB/BaiF CoA-transferase family protein [Candidatus Aminicenantes bacterium]|nr:CaiB/BaiF CoA-transferase family protein [Candidatus Aminicenantes bacterium]HRY65996.1 CaiB/BaiF CoA-transferase family protein [Candidatus Aminicenantes bacterium]HRZ72955.1 CaiB/BaiF CoA-transferase family protein [Candidatus Aminicenantes bacterium]